MGVVGVGLRNTNLEAVARYMKTNLYQFFYISSLKGEYNYFCKNFSLPREATRINIIKLYIINTLMGFTRTNLYIKTLST